MNLVLILNSHIITNTFNFYITYNPFFQGITYPCDVCDYVAARPDALKRHKKGKHEEKKFLCDQCQFRAHSAIKLSQHKLTAHVGIRYPCNMCDFQASKLAKLKEHKMTAHDGASFPCDECEKVFPSPKGLKDHKAVHRSGPKFQCEECGFSTTVVESLQTHIDSVHKGNKLIIIQIIWRREYFLFPEVRMKQTWLLMFNSLSFLPDLQISFPGGQIFLQKGLFMIHKPNFPHYFVSFQNNSTLWLFPKKKF